MYPFSLGKLCVLSGCLSFLKVLIGVSDNVMRRDKVDVCTHSGVREVYESDFPV